MKQVILAFFTSIIFLFATQNATAGIIHHDFDLELPGGGLADFIDLDKDGVMLKEAGFSDLSSGLLALIYNGVTSFSIVPLTIGDIVDTNTPMLSVSNVYGLLDGINYIGTYGITSCNTCYGFIELNFDGQDIFLTGFTYETTSDQGIEVTPNPGTPVPEPSSIVLLGFALIGLAYTKKKRA